MKYALSLAFLGSSGLGRRRRRLWRECMYSGGTILALIGIHVPRLNTQIPAVLDVDYQHICGAGTHGYKPINLHSGE
ncbi:hypothetical protein BDN72DRAFT_844446 [Pluteus cervinus]|uniref:Uncharacterized protein n=1 Tax=Pluteus cervinus TaxID=181527 RepID=A0ACD3AN73_9AGAR|nr:hypothetical protein BDN72DRAFT_844446 [Pluteus cervinus]